MKSWMQDNDIEMHSTNERNSVVAERFIKILKKLEIYDFSIKKCVFW